MKIKELLEYKLSDRQKRNALDNKATIIITMPPKVFLELTTDGEYDLSGIKTRLQAKEFYQDLMDKEEITVHPFLQISSTGKINGHEGRARALAAMLAGDKEYEVAVTLWPPSRSLSIKDIPSDWIGQFNSKKKFSFLDAIETGVVKVLNDNVQKQYQNIREDAESGKNTAKAWYDSNTNTLYSMPEGWHHTGYLVYELDPKIFTKTWGASREDYIRGYEQFGKLTPKYDADLVSIFIDNGWVRLGYDYDSRKPSFYAQGMNIKKIARAVSVFYKDLEKKGLTLHPNLYISTEAEDEHSEQVVGENFFRFLKTGLVKHDMVTEKRTYVHIKEFNKDIFIWSNPSISEIESLLKKQIKQGEKYPHLRGYYDDKSKTYYVWNAKEAIHGQVARDLGLEYDWHNRCDILQKSSDGEVAFDCEFFDKLENELVISRLKEKLPHIFLEGK